MKGRESTNIVGDRGIAEEGKKNKDEGGRNQSKKRWRQ